MKCVGIQYIEAVRALKDAGYVPKRTIYLLYVPGTIAGWPPPAPTSLHPCLASRPVPLARGLTCGCVCVVCVCACVVGCCR
jgi:hypothetical protein